MHTHNGNCEIIWNKPNEALAPTLVFSKKPKAKMAKCFFTKP